ncbi:MAG: hypothetical protein AAGA76_03185 [Pseudomonadota bacterium]
MKKRTKIIIASSAGLVALSGIAFAAQEYDQHQKTKRLFSPEKIMEQIDANGDLAASREELFAFAGKHFTTADADNDQKVTKSEIVTAIEASKAPKRMKQRSGRIADRLVRGADINQDGSLTMAELENRLGKFHAFVDWNDDNSVEIAEAKRMRAGFGRGWRKGNRK